MIDFEIIHKILTYVCSFKDKDSFETDQISKEINLPLSETNILVRRMIANGDVKECTTKDISDKGAVGLLKISETTDAYETKKYLNEGQKKYNVFIRTNSGVYNVMDLPEQKLSRIVTAYKKGKDSFTLSGVKSWIKGLQTIKIFVFEKRVNLAKFHAHCEENGLLAFAHGGRSGDTCFTLEALSILGVDVTDDIIGDIEYGDEREVTEAEQITNGFVNLSRLDELKSINHPEFDLIRLIRFCEELNSNFKQENYLSVGMIGRTILNHIPPIFGFKTFEQVTRNYGGPENKKSFKRNMEHLNTSLRSIADSYLHQTIRNPESLPNGTQVDFRQDMDVLLEEIVRVLAK